MAELPVQIRASGAVGGCAPVHAVAPTSLLWQIRPGDPTSQVLAFCLAITNLIRCLLSYAHHMPPVLLLVFSSLAFCPAISILITCLVPSYQYSHHKPSVLLSIVSSQAFCLPISAPITCLLFSYWCSHHMPSVFLSEFSSHAFCLLSNTSCAYCICCCQD